MKKDQEYFESLTLEQRREHMRLLKNEVDKPLVAPESEDFEVQILVDESVAPAAFIPSKEKAGIYFANSLTIRAMKKDIFTIGESIDELQFEINCKSCQQKLDVQFWTICPYCGGQYS